MICAFLLIFFMILEKEHRDRIEAYIYSIIIWTSICFGVTEIFSLFKAIKCLNLWILWGTVDIILLVVWGRKKDKKYILKKAWRDILKSFYKKHVFAFLLFSLVMSLLAVKMVPYNWDSMTYHCARLFHWMQNQSVAHYATNIDRQIASPVLGAFVNLNVYVMLTGSDRMLNLLQCLSYLTNGVLVYNISRKLKCSKASCIMASVLFFSMPIAFAEALTTQVDNFSTLWLLSFVYLLLDFLHVSEKLVFQKYSVMKVVLLGMCVAFGYLTKPSIGFAMVIFALWLLIVSIIRKDQVIVVLKLIICAIPAMVLVLIPEFLRNFITFHALAAPGVGERQLIGTLNGKYILVNLLKNFTFNFPNIWVNNSSEFVYKNVMRIASLLAVDINNPAISEDGREFMVHMPQTYGCDTAVNSVIILLLLISMVCFIFKLKLVKVQPLRTGYYMASVVSFLIFCAVLRWEPFVSRYMLSYLTLLCPAIVIAIENFSKGKSVNIKLVLYSITCFLCVIEVFGLLLYHGKIAFGYSRNYGYFADRREIYKSYAEMSDYINDNDIQSIGLHIGGDSYEYPLTRMVGKGVAIEHVNVSNETSIYEKSDFVPEIIFASGLGIQEQINYHNNMYILVKYNDNEALYLLDRASGV